jgi:hypothetical protein
MTIDECYSQMIEFERMANESSNLSDKKRFIESAESYGRQFDEMYKAAAAEREKIQQAKRAIADAEWEAGRPEREKIQQAKRAIADAEWEAGRPERERIAAEAHLQQRKDRLIARVTKSGIEYNNWIEWANSLYEITPEFKVISHAVERKKEMSWECDSDIGCLERIETLIGYKIADRKRGIGDENKDLAIA